MKSLVRVGFRQDKKRAKIKMAKFVKKLNNKCFNEK